MVVGLGNPGAKYAGNRHNLGASAVTSLAGGFGETLRPHRSRCLTARLPWPLGGAAIPLILAQPTTHMNEAGRPVRALLDYYGVNSSRLIVIHDDLELDFGAIRAKRGGGESGHNGLRSISAALGTRDYGRLRVGIGRPPGRGDPAAFVLKDFSKHEQREIPHVFHDIQAALEEFVTG